MTDVNVTATVDDIVLEGVATEETVADLRDLVAARLEASILTTPVVEAVDAVTAALPAKHADGGALVHVVNPTAGLATDTVLQAVRDRLPSAGAASQAGLDDLLGRVGPTASDNLLALLRQVVTNTAAEVAKVTHLDLTADTLNLSTDNLEGLLTTLNALVSSEATLAAFRSANHTDLALLHTDLVTLQGYVDGLEGFTDGIEALLTGLAAQLPAALHADGGLKVHLANTGTISVGSASISKGYQQLTSTAAAATLASLCSGGALPSGATKARFFTTAAIRVRDDGTNPTASIGMPVLPGQQAKYDGDQLAALKVYGAATIDAWFYT